MGAFSRLAEVPCFRTSSACALADGHVRRKRYFQPASRQESEETGVCSTVPRLAVLVHVLDVLLRMCSCRSVRLPPDGVDFEAHKCFFAPEVGSFYATHWVAPIVSPSEHAGHLKNCDHYNFRDVFPAAPASEFLPYIRIVVVRGDP